MNEKIVVQYHFLYINFYACFYENNFVFELCRLSIDSYPTGFYK